jgi:hypothetical protein
MAGGVKGALSGNFFLTKAWNPFKKFGNNLGK